LRLHLWSRKALNLDLKSAGLVAETTYAQHRLLAAHGPGLPMPDLRRIIAVDCPWMLAGHVHDVCGMHLPGLVSLAW
jgi:hypothetical protein